MKRLERLEEREEVAPKGGSKLERNNQEQGTNARLCRNEDEDKAGVGGFGRFWQDVSPKTNASKKNTNLENKGLC